MKTSSPTASRSPLFRPRRVLTVILLVAGSLAPLTLRSVRAEAPALPTGTAKGTFSPAGKPAVTLTNAAAFVDKKDSDKPTILILSDKKLPTEKWTSEFDLMMSHPTFTGVVFWLNAEGVAYRCDTYDNSKQASVSGYFKLKLDGAMGKDLKGTVASNENPDAKDPRADVSFHAATP